MRYLILAILFAGTMSGVAQPPDSPSPPAPSEGVKKAAPGEPGPGRTANETTRELLEQVMMARLSKELALDDEQTVLLVRAVSEFRERMAELRRERVQLMNDLKSASKEGKDSELIEAQLQALIGHDEKIALARRELFERAGSGLTAWQRAKLYLFLGDFEVEIKRLLKKAQERVDRLRDGEPFKNPYGRPGRPGMRPPQPPAQWSGGPDSPPPPVPPEAAAGPPPSDARALPGATSAAP